MISMYLRTHQPCGTCGSSDALTEYANGNYCFSCHKYFSNRRKNFNSAPQRPEKTLVLPPRSDYLSVDAVALFQSMPFFTILPILSKRYGLYYSAAINRLVLPVYCGNDLIMYQTRRLAQDGTPKYLSYGPKVLGHCTSSGVKYLVLVEDFFSYINVDSSDCGLKAASLFGTSLTDSMLATIIKLAPEHIIVWLDGDVPGRLSSRKVADKLRLFFKSVTIVHTLYDPKFYKPHEIETICKIVS
jgi:hypothetical protein